MAALSNKANLWRIIAAFALFAAALPIEIFTDIPVWGAGIVYGAIYLLIAYDVVIKCFENLIRGRFLDENFLMTVASVGAFALTDFKEGVAVMIFYQVGELFQRYALGKSRRSIADLMSIRSDTARVVADGAEREIEPEAVAIGDVLVVRTGEKVPVDGVVLSEGGTLDCSALTGESMPVRVEYGGEALSGSVNTGAELRIRAEKLYAESTVARILELVENASDKKAKAENFITKFARWYTPAVVGLALLLAIVPSLVTGAWMQWIERGLTFLVVSCPCALVISVPMTFFCGIGAASRRGVLVKGSNYLELLGKANLFVFDKTGTLTEGKFAVEAVYPAEKREDVLRLAAIAEAHSNHPIARAVCAAYGGAGASDFVTEEIAGKGMRAVGKEGVILAGSAALLTQEGIVAQPIDTDGSAVYVALNGAYVGAITVRDRIKADAFDTVAELKRQGRVVMLTGDRADAAAATARRLGIEDYAAELLPKDKADKMEEIFRNKKPRDVVAFAGDGINDAPVLMRADVGVAMGALGSDAAIESADVVLMHDDLASIAVARKIAGKTVRIVRQNIVFALGVKLAVLILSAFGLTDMWLAVFADVGVAVLAILNALRANRLKKE